MNLSTVFAKMAMLVLIMLLGYLCARIGITGPEFNQRVTPLVMNVLLTATILNSVLSVPDFTGREIVDYVLVLTAATVLQVVMAWFLPRLLRTRSEDVGATRLVTAFGNVGFVGLPVVAAIFGDEMVFFASLCNIPFNLALYSIGAAQLSGTDGARLDWRKVLNMPVIATLLSVVLLLSRIHVPAVIADTISTLAGATIPLSMLIIGTSLGAISVRAALTEEKVPERVPVERKQVERAAVRNHKIRTDTGIEISFPAEMGSNSEYIEFVNEPNGLISIELKNIGSIENR